MTAWCRTLLLGSLGVTFGCAAPNGPRDPDLSAGAVAAAESIAAEALAQRQIPGLALVVLRGDETLLARGYGRTEASGTEAVADTTVFQLGSIGKQFLAALVLVLAEEEKLSLDDPVSAHLPEFRQLPPSLLVHHLLSHTSGVRELFTQTEYLAGIEDLERGAAELVAIARESPVDWTPGSRWSYSNTNYTILALLVERLTGAPYEHALAERLFRPLGLGSLRQCTPLPRGPGEARGHVRGEHGIVPAPPENMNWIRGDGGICGSAMDVARWTRLLSKGRVLSPSSYALMTAPTRLAEEREAEYGFGLSLVAPDGRRKIAHGGAMLGFTNIAAYYPDTATTVVVLTNLGNVWTESIERPIARRLLDLPEPERREHRVESEERRRFVGAYDIGVFDIRVTDRDGRLWLEMPPPGPTVPLAYLGDGAFAGEADPDSVGLQFAGGEGPAREVRLHMAAMYWYGTRRPPVKGRGASISSAALIKMSFR